MKISNEIEISRVVHFIDEINRNHPDKFVYRGLKDISYELVPSIARFPHLYDSSSFEWGPFSTDLLKAFKNRYEMYAKKPLDNDYDYQIVGQHYGLITNMLDWSQLPLVALYFAVDDVKHYEPDPSSNGLVWALTELEPLFPSREMKIPDTNKAVVYFPKYLSARLAAQQGCFTIHKYPERNEPFVALDKMKGDSELKKYIIKGEAKKGIRIQLNHLGINEHTLFPELDGLCRQLTWKFTNTNYPQTVKLGNG